MAHFNTIICNYPFEGEEYFNDMINSFTLVYITFENIMNSAIMYFV